MKSNICTRDENVDLIKKQHIYKMDVAEERMLRWMCGKTKKDKIRNESFRKHLGVASIGDKIRKTHLRCFDVSNTGQQRQW